MAFNKNKSLESALKYLNQGKVSQAIAEYQQILRHDAKDQATLMTVGDLYARQGDMPHAIEYFERLAQVYLQEGFNSKAIAIYKKIAKLAPAESDPLERLADLYVQQGVLSEARPLFLQIAETHLKANRATKAVEVLHRLLEVEPENPRVQMRLAELYNLMGRKKDASQTYFAYAQRLSDRGDNEEALKLIERAVEVEPGHSAALFLKAKIFTQANKDEQAIAILENHAEADAGGDVTKLLVDLDLKSGQIEKAADRGRNQLVRGSAHFPLLLKVAETLLERNQGTEALALLRELRDPMIEAGELDKFQKMLNAATEQIPDQTEGLEIQAEFFRHTSDPFQLTNALMKLVEIYTAAGNQTRAEQLLEELLDRNKDDERIVARLKKLRGGSEEQPEAVAAAAAGAEAASNAAEEESETADQPVTEPGPVIEEPPLDEETQTYIAHALTDVDLFSSYGLNHKAIHLLENVLRRAPRHTPTLERLLDFYVGAGNDQRTAELAAWMEKVHSERGDKANTERFGEMRKRFQEIVGATTEELLAAAISPEPPTPEFEVPLMAVQPDPVSSEASAISLAPQIESLAPGEELDLSDEWEAMVQEVSEPPVEASRTPTTTCEEDTGPVAAENEETVLEIEAEPAPASEPNVFEIEDVTTEASGQAFEFVEEPAKELSAKTTAFEIPAAEVAVPAVEDLSALNLDFDLELTPETADVNSAENITTEDFLTDLAAEIDDMEPLSPEPANLHVEEQALSSDALASAAAPAMNEPSTVFDANAESLHQLAEVFQDFRNEMGGLTEENEDLETHYNLGIAYREMGLLDEAIGEFQKVAKAVQKGRPFRYAMNCSTLLAVSFVDKGEPKIASLWYQRALETPGLDPEAILALRYDLAVALEMAGESGGALESFRQVYAMNIDYRDVADRIATLQHQ
jgi:tetratricopeptide (TPR) repeat protein